MVRRNRPGRSLPYSLYASILSAEAGRDQLPGASSAVVTFLRTFSLGRTMVRGAAGTAEISCCLYPKEAAAHSPGRTRWSIKCSDGFFLNWKNALVRAVHLRAIFDRSLIFHHSIEALFGFQKIPIVSVTSNF